MSRYARKIDVNQPDIIEALETCGAKVLVLSAMGGGVPDLFVTVGHRFTFVEVKSTPATWALDKRSAPAQADFAKDWPVRLIRSVEEAVQMVSDLRTKTEDEGSWYGPPSALTARVERF